MECGFFTHPETHLTIGFSRKDQLKCIGTTVMILYICVKIRLFGSIMNLKNFENRASQPAVRPGCARCRALKITQTTGYYIGFMKLLFRRQFS